MIILRTLAGALAGWSDIVWSRPGWATHFRLTGAGLLAALAIYYLVIFLVMLAGTLGAGANWQSLLTGMVVQSLPILALVLSALLITMMLRQTDRLMALLVPGIYALIAYTVSGTVLSLLLLQLTPLAFVLIAFLLYKLARLAGSWNVGISLGFALFTVALLVALPLSLYMLAQPTGPI